MFVLVYVTCKDEKEAEKIGRLLLENNLVVCVNFTAMVTSMFFWPSGSEKIEKTEEIILILKSRIENFYRISELVKSNHSYEIPAIFAIPIVAMEKNYEKWAVEELAKK